MKKVFEIILVKLSEYFFLALQSKIAFYDKNYTLSGAIFHYGKTVLRCHYTAVVQKIKYWFKTDDTRVSKCS